MTSEKSQSGSESGTGLKDASTPLASFILRQSVTVLYTCYGEMSEALLDIVSEGICCLICEEV